ncbi:acyl-CoA thioesterase [Acidovorax sp.]|jgi:acyl-CoA hydrolase|uniref:acyl-CoA thioesterase n=1 Tax=Acidovorax sp. TaxID=1872122 RepID=UPI00391FC6D4
MHSITLRFLASHTAPSASGRIHGGTVLRWMDEAGFACASAWAGGTCVTALMGATSFDRPIHPGDLVEVQASLAHTGETSMHMLIEVRSGGIQAKELPGVAHCVAVYAALDEGGQPLAVDKFTPETPGDMALAERVNAQVEAARPVQA